jgi:hypothetical protein
MSMSEQTCDGYTPTHYAAAALWQEGYEQAAQDVDALVARAEKAEAERDALQIVAVQLHDWIMDLDRDAGPISDYLVPNDRAATVASALAAVDRLVEADDE